MKTISSFSHSAFLTALFLVAWAAGSSSAAVLYVDANSSAPRPPYTNWATAARVIQNAVDAAAAGDKIVVANGTYGPTAITKPLAVRSVNGPGSTVINGGGGGGWGARCAYLTSGASLSGFTLTQGFTWMDYGSGVFCESRTVVVSNCVLTGNRGACRGGGAYGGTLNNCTLSGNSAAGPGKGACGWGGGASSCTLNNCTLSGNSALFGGGASDSTLNNCTLTGNSADNAGGGASGCTLNNCTLTGNSGAYLGGGGASECTLNNCTLTGNSGADGGGAAWSVLNNCIVYFNTATTSPNYHPQSAANYCCTTPMPTNGVGNITNAPLFVNQAGGNLRLRTNSPCINAGNNAYARGATDLDGLPRIVGGTVDMGAYEFQGAAPGLFIAWLQQYGLPTDGSADHTDADADGLNNWQEWRCATDPTDALSVLRLVSALPSGTDVVVSWQSVAGVSYLLERTTNLGARPAFLTVTTNIAGQAGTTTSTDTNAAPLAPLFYRVGVGD